MKNCRRIPWNVTAICEIFRTDCLMGKTPYEIRFCEPFRGAIVPYGSLVEYHPISTKDQSSWKESTPMNLLRLCIVRGGNLERRHPGCGL